MNRLIINLMNNDLIKAGRPGLVQRPVEIQRKDGSNYTRMMWCKATEDEVKDNKSAKTDEKISEKPHKTEDIEDAQTQDEQPQIEDTQKIQLVTQNYTAGNIVETTNIGHVKIDHITSKGVGIWYHDKSGDIKYQAIKPTAFFDILKEPPTETTKSEQPKARKSTIKTLFNKLSQSVSKQIEKEEPNFYKPDDSGWVASDWSNPEEYLTKEQEDHLKELSSHLTMTHKQLVEYYNENDSTGKPFSYEVEDEEEYEEKAKYRIAIDFMEECVRHHMGDSDDAEFKEKQKEFKQFYKTASVEMKPWSNKVSKKSKTKQEPKTKSKQEPKSVQLTMNLDSKPKKKDIVEKEKAVNKPTELEQAFSSHDGDISSFVSDLRTKHGKEQTMSLAKNSGVQWKEHDNPNINWMRCAMAIKSKFDTSEPTKKPEKIKKDSMSNLTSNNPKLDIKEFSNLKNTDKTKALEYLKTAGISWNEHSHEGVNWMRAMMAMKKHTTKASKTVSTSTSKPTTQFESLSSKQAINYVYDIGNKQSEGVSDSEFEELREYVSSYHYQINTYLRTGEFPESVQSKEDRIELTDIVNTITKLTDNNTIPNNLRAYRGTSPAELGLSTDATFEDYKKLIGSTIQDKGVKSVTLDKDITSKFEKGVVVNLNVPKGTNGIALSGIYKAKTGFHNEEAELLLARGTNMKITSVDKKDGKISIDAELVDKKSSNKATKSTKTKENDKHKDFITAVKNEHGKDTTMKLASESGVQWKEHDNPNINWMRCAIAMKKHLDSGGSIKTKKSLFYATKPLRHGVNLIIHI